MTPPESAVDGFAASFGGQPAGVWSAPGRVNLIGEHTDYNEGFVLPFAIDRRTCVALRLREDRVMRVASTLSDEVAEHDLDSVSSASVGGWSAYAFATAWGLGRVGADPDRMRGFDAYVASDVPVGAGLSSSAAIGCALALGLAELWETGLGRDALVSATHLAENEIVGAPTGILDQTASLLCTAGSALFVDCRDESHEQVPLALEPEGLRLLVIDTRVHHAHAESGYADRRASCERGARECGVPALRDLSPADLPRARSVLDPETYRRVRHIVTENERVWRTVALLRWSGPRAIGELLLESHASMRDDFEISVPELDLAVETATRAGALGARMTGGGFGGSAIALVEREDAERIGAAVSAAFRDAGLAAAAVFPVVPSDGARRESDP